jgi:hypothetical protein
MGSVSDCPFRCWRLLAPRHRGGRSEGLPRIMLRLHVIRISTRMKANGGSASRDYPSRFGCSS